MRSPASLVENLPIGIYTCDRAGLIVQYNRRAAELWGRAPALGDPDSLCCGAFKIMDRQGREVAVDESPMAVVLATGQPVRDRELTVERQDGTRVAILANVDPIFDEHGTLLGGVNCFQDVGELVRVKDQMREGRRVARHVMEALPAAIYTTDAEGRLLYYNKAAERLWGFAPKIGEQLWCGSWKIYLPDGTLLPHDRCPMAVALKEQRALVGPEAVVERPDGTRVPFLPYPTPLFGSDGELIGGVNMLIDLTGQKRADAQQRGLIDELNHRVKNTLATIQSLAAQTMRGPHGDGEFEGRLLSLSRVHDQLTRNAWEWADLAAIAGDTFRPLRGSANSHVAIEGPSVKLKPRIALAMGMVLHELACNAMRHGALSTPAGTVALRWRVEGRMLLVDWREEGGPAVAAPRKRGFGTRLLERSIAHELGGRPTIAFSAAGVHCTMEIPLPE
ncbi:MAG: HWE histidine kinase domain-containing protein [Rhizomicrobium sp.]